MKAEGQSFGFEHGKFVGVIEPSDGKMFLGGLEVLTDGHDPASDGAEILHDFSDLIERLPHADDEP